MKKILLLFIAITSFGCSNDDSTPVDEDAKKGVSLELVSKYCGDDICTIIYSIKNQSKKNKYVTVEVTLSDVDRLNPESVNRSGEYVESFSESHISISHVATNNIEAIEIVDVVYAL